IPSSNASRFIATWDDAEVKPSVFAVEAPQACFGLKGNTGSDRFCEKFSETAKLIRMNRSVSRPVFQLLQLPARILDDLDNDGFETTIRGEDSNLARYPVN